MEEGGKGEAKGEGKGVRNYGGKRDQNSQKRAKKIEKTGIGKEEW
jgi:hypothetical protein